MSFTIHTTRGLARRGTLKTSHGKIETPFFMAVATKGSVKAVTPSELHELGTQIVLSNTYHLVLRPGMSVIRKAGGLHRFMKWDGPILTDSGGYQVFSLAKFRKITDRGVVFRSHVDGSRHELTPESSIHIQEAIGSDIMMVLDDVRAHDVPRSVVREAVERTTAWAARSVKAKRSRTAKVFSIVQGGIHRDMRQTSAKQITKIACDGYAIGGLAVGETEKDMYAMTKLTTALLPKNKPRYFMGGARPYQIVELVKRGVDMFDCVIPTRNARHGKLYVWKKKPHTLSAFGRTFFAEMNIRSATYAKDMRPVDASCACMTCTTFSRAYLRHLFAAEEPLALRLATIHNLAFYLELMSRIQKSI
ncbi:MAG: tRNA guanosine(34) transglycosylase Tgt [Candidatus Kerfeldbacteria bacterium]|nr:tRNA guanosine(34) transglycosylase Tgt [Candidatus Kerfeldbacteria bacterium]